MPSENEECGCYRQYKQAMIRERAYYRWLAAGCPAGREWEFWFEAEKEVTEIREDLTK